MPSDDISNYLLIAFLASFFYAVGRYQQWTRDGRGRDWAFREGYNLASTAMLSNVAEKLAKPKENNKMTVLGRPARHSVEDRGASTVRLESVR